MGDVPQQKWRLELRAYEALQKLMADAETVRALFEEAGLDLPEPLLRFLGDFPNGSDSPDEARMSVSPLPQPPRPREWESGWIWVPLADALLQNVMLAIMRGHTGAIPAKEIHERIATFDPNANLTSLYNTGSRFEQAGAITKSEEGWQLVKPQDAPVLYEGNVWGPPKVFGRHEIAAYRRIVIRHLLSAAPDGLQVMQIVRHLQQDADLWPPALGGVSKDLVEADLERMLAQKKARRVGHSRKWVAITPAR